MSETPATEQFNPNDLAMPPADILALCRVSRKVMLHFMTRNSCIAATRVIIECLKRMGYRAVALPTKFVLGVPELKLAYTSGATEEEIQTAKDSRQFFFDDTPDTGWNGHLVALVEKKWIIDPTFDQADVALGGKLELQQEAMIFPVPSNCTESFSATYKGFLDNGMEVEIQYLASGDHTYKETEAWKDEGLPFLAASILHPARGVSKAGA